VLIIGSMVSVTMRLLDCTLRDGGYYNNWDFAYDTVCSYLKAVSKAGVDIVEIGFRNFPQDDFSGPYAYASDDVIAELPLPDGLKIAVMIDASTILAYDQGVSRGIDRLFSPAADSPVDIVRVAAHFRDIARCQSILEKLSSLGYELCLNIMQSGSRSDRELSEAGKLVQGWNLVSVLYFADSLGNMDENNITRVIHSLRQEWRGLMGVHAHNNKGQAVRNTLLAIDLGIDIADSTMLGMGRGAGNAQTEILLMEMASRGKGNYLAKELFHLVLDHFEPLRQSYGWGPSMLYHYAADHDIHPTYIQELVSDCRYDNDDLINTLTHVSGMDSNSFNRPLLETARAGGNEKLKLSGGWDATEFCKGNDVLILGAGPSLGQHINGIRSFIRKYNPLVISVNIHREIDSREVDYFVAAQQTRLTLEALKHGEIDRPLITPMKNMTNELSERLKGKVILDYDMAVVPNQIEFHATGCVLPAPLSIAYALSLASVGAANRVFMVGFDGYGGDDPRQQEMIATLELISKEAPGIELISLTPTTYPLKRGSVYAPY